MISLKRRNITVIKRFEILIVYTTILKRKVCTFFSNEMENKYNEEIGSMFDVILPTFP